MNDFGEYYTEQQSDGTWICGADYDNDVVVVGETEAEALQNMVLALHHANGVHCVQYMKNEPDLKAIKKARAVLAENGMALETAKELIKQASPDNQIAFNELILSVALNTLADALEGGGDANETSKEEDRYKEAIGWIIGTLSKGYDDEETVHHIRQDLIEQGIMNEEGDMIDE